MIVKKEELNMTNLIFFPGTLSDYRLLEPQKKEFPNLHVPPWIAPLKRSESLASYSKRLAATLSPQKPFYLGGVSLGGMIAQEVAKHLKPEGVIMIATASTGKSLPLFHRIMGKIIRYTPRFLIRLWLRLNAFIIRHIPMDDKSQRMMMADMVQDIPPKLVQWQSAAPNNWKLDQKLDVPVTHIHGDKDPLIPIKNVVPTKIVKNGGHLINVTHATEVNQFIKEATMKSDINPSLQQPSMQPAASDKKEKINELAEEAYSEF
jgi:pimeloyl-ACP methyl ester carboxylesterase